MVTIFDIEGNVLLEVDVDDTSSSYRSIDGRHELTLKYALSSPFEVPLGSWCMFQNERFELMSHQDVRMKHTKHYSYTLVMKGSFGLLSRYKVKNNVDGRLMFDIIARPKEIVDLIVWNLNRRGGGWQTGECIDAEPRLMSFNHTDCASALTALASEFETEYEVSDKTISLKKVEYYKSNPIALAYGKGNGFKTGVGRTNYEDGLPSVTMYVQGGSKNISYKDYGASELHLPVDYGFRFDGRKFEGEEGFVDDAAREFMTDSLGSSVSILNGKIGREDSIDLSEIYPNRIGHVSKVVYLFKEIQYEEPDPSWTEEDWNEVQVDFFDDSIPEDLDFNECLLENNEPLTVVFQSGEIAGLEFDATFIKKGNRFQLVKQEYMGQPMPQGSFVPMKDDAYAVFNVSLPASYISDKSTHSGAEFEALRAATMSLYEKSYPRFTFSGELDDIWSRKNWVNVGGRLKIGAYVSFTNEEVTNDGPALVRIVGITQNVNNPHAPKLELSNVTHKGSVSSRIEKLENKDAHVSELTDETKRYAKRRFSDLQRSVEMIEKAIGDGFEDSIKPATVQTMMMLVGDERLQFAFVEEVGSDVRANRNDYFDSETKTFKFEPGILKNYTIGVNEIRSKLDQQHRYWILNALESAVLDNPDTEYYVYAFVDKEGETGEFRLEAEPVDLELKGEEDDGKYHLLMGLLLSERDGARDYLPLYGFTQVQPGQITTDVIRSADGECYFDLARNEIGGVIKFKAGSYGELNIGSQNMLRNSGFTGDYLSEPLADEEVMEASKELYSDPLDHWTKSGTVSVISLDRAVSGKAVRIEGALSKIAQELYYPMIEGEEYVLSFKAVSMSTTAASVIQITCGGVTELVSIEAEEKRHVIKIKAVSSSKDFTVELFNNVPCVIYDLQLERGTIATAWGNSPFDNSSDRVYFQSLKYLQQALKGSTTQAGGLILSQLIRLGDTSNQTEFVEKAGANGYYVDDNSPAFWAGGSMEQATNLIGAYENNPNAELTDEQIASMAKFAVTHGGRVIMSEAITRGTIHADKGYFGDFKINGLYAESRHTESHGCKWGDGLYKSWYDERVAEQSASGFSDVDYHGISSIDHGFRTNLPYYADPAQTNNKFSFFANSGMIGGMRPALRVIDNDGSSSAPNQVYNADHTLIIRSTNTVYLKMPDNPSDGCEVVIMTIYDGGVIITNGDIYDMKTGTNANGWSSSTKARRKVSMVYSKEIDLWILNIDYEA